MISSCVVTLDHRDHGAIESVIQQCAALPGVDVGAITGFRLPLTIEADDERELKSMTRQLQLVSGVELVDVVFVAF